MQLNVDGVVAVIFFFLFRAKRLQSCRSQLWCSSPLYGITAIVASDLGLAAHKNREEKKERAVATSVSR